ncbi:uncharacterized protein SCHCODRAFT_02626224 [Schizophyllum commune H4-8]|uniref:uncharacterized protein n=1 Tax=Schizophyllum commune (strain H4-8 / FGSC 9210) TaxID=578458 RepID=UPI00215DD5AF|nr:uncharacterized protein SCHCODRAFT_02626224 [Schizophyllum commune H4-8]KAI5892474.1 hypothetical protein SCHCODRAFT_02626224 [Schizophyllum commune H4-8]
MQDNGGHRQLTLHHFELHEAYRRVSGSYDIYGIGVRSSPGASRHIDHFFASRICAVYDG